MRETSKTVEKIFKEIFVVINKIRADFKYSFLFLRKFCCNLKKMKVCENFDEIRGKVSKTNKKILQK